MSFSTIADHHIEDFASALAWLIQQQNEAKMRLSVDRTEENLAREAFYRGQVSIMGSMTATLGIRDVVRAKAVEIINRNPAMTAQC